MSVDKFIKVQKQGDIYYYKCPNNTMSGQSCFISMRSNLNRELYYNLPNDAVLVDCNEVTTTVTTTQPTTTLSCDIQFQSLGFVNNSSFPYDYTLSKGYIQVVMTTLSRNPSYQFQILSGTTVIMDWTDPISTFNTFYFKVSCANYTVKARDFYNQSCVININNISVPCVTTTATSTTSTTTTTVPTTTSSTTTSTTTTTTTVPTWNPCSVYSLESKYVDTVENGHPNRETKVLINNYNQFTNTYLYYGEILLASSLDYTNNGFTTASYYKLISSTSLNNVGYTLVYDPNVNHDYVVVSYNLTTKTVIESKTLNFNNRGIINTYPNKSEILAITIDNNGNLYCSSKFGIDKYVISGSNWGFVKNVTPSSYNTSLASSTDTDLPFNDGYNAIMTSMNYIPNLDAIVWSFGGDFVILCNVDGSGKVATLFTFFSTTTLSTFVKDNFLYFSRVLEYNSSTDRNFYNYTAPNDIPRSSLIGKLDISDVSKNDLTHVWIPLPNPFDNLPMQFYNTIPATNKIADFVQSMACKNLYAQNQFTISEPTLTCYVEYLEANFIIYGGSDNYEISIDGGTSWTHYSDADVTITLPRTTHITILGYDVYLVKIKDNDTNIIHHFYISNTTNCQ